MCYQETVVASRWMALPLGVGGVALLLGLVATFADGALGAGERALVVAVLLVAGAALMLVVWWFMRLRIAVADELRVAFGPVHRTLHPASVQRVEVRPYRWIEYGGWGIRLRLPWHRHEQAWTVPFVASGVLVTQTDGGSLYISSTDPPRLAQAVQTMIDTGRAETDTDE